MQVAFSMCCALVLPLKSGNLGFVFVPNLQTCHRCFTFVLLGMSTIFLRPLVVNFLVTVQMFLLSNNDKSIIPFINLLLKTYMLLRSYPNIKYL